jgi:hypothetical protein
MPENGMAAGGVSPRADIARAKASAARNANGAPRIRRRRVVDEELLPEVVVVFIWVRFLSCVRDPFLDSAFGLTE